MNRISQITAILSVVAGLLSGAAAAPPAPTGSLGVLLKQLGSAEFQTRIDATQQLTGLSADELQAAVALLPNEPSAEAIVRCMAELNSRFISNDSENVARASESLEELAKCSRLLVADEARSILDRHWRVRVDVALARMKSLGAIVKQGTFVSAVQMWPRSPAATVQVMIGEEWTGSEQDISLFERLSYLVEAGGNGGVVVYLLEGHPLTADHRRELTEIVGADRTQERSRIALGITRDPRISQHVLIGQVTKGGSAYDAGLRAGDLIVAIENPDKAELQGEERAAAEKAELLRDFDDLVERLKVYREGEVIKLRVIRRFFSGRAAAEEIVDVPLKGWADLEPSR